MSENGNVKETAVIPAENAEAVEKNSLIVVKQLPVIEEQLKTIRADIEHKVSGVLALECTEGTVKAIKVLRADLNKDFKDLEERRKFVKSKILEPYENFEAVYKECVTEIFKGADTELKKRIDEVENNLKFEKRKEIEDYFNEYKRCGKGGQCRSERRKRCSRCCWRRCYGGRCACYAIRQRLYPIPCNKA